MPTERWDDERLDRLATTVENIGNKVDTLTIKVDSLASTVEIHSHLIESNARVIQALANAIAEAREERQEIFQRMDRQQAEIVGLRTETNRLLDILLNQRDRCDNPTN